MTHLRFLSVILCACFLSPFAYADGEVEDLITLRTKAENNDINAQYRLATEYFYGNATMKANRELAVFWYRKAAEGGHPYAQFNLGICFERGLGIHPNPSLALENYEKAAKQGVLSADYNRAMLLLLGVKGKTELDSLKPDIPLAISILEDLAKQEYVPAMVELAVCYLYDPNPSMENQIKAFKLLKRAVKYPDVSNRGIRLLADCYYGGVGIEKKNIAETVRLLNRAIERNDVESMAKMAFLLEQGEIKGAPEENKKKAFELFKRAAELNLPMAQYKYAEFLADGYVEGKGLDDAMIWYDKAAAANCVQAIHRLGLFALQGVGRDEPDKQLAASLFFQAAKAGYAPSQYSLGIMIYEGDGVVENHEQALFWFVNAASNGHLPAMRCVARALMEGDGCPKNEAKAYEWLKKAADAGDFTALQILESNSRLLR